MRFFSFKQHAWRKVAVACTAAATIAAAPSLAQAQADTPAAAVSQDAQTSDEATPLEAGPIHEAYATPVSINPEPGPVISEMPPEDIDEVPPEFRPEGRNVQWIPGYWAFVDATEDSEESAFRQSEFVWVSGVWRDVPQGRMWVPGFWSEAALQNGYRWTPGYWAAEGQNFDQMAYIPQAPPASVDNGPSSPAPSVNHFWVPGYWEYANNDYAWHAGYWYERPQNFVWVPHCYQYTPRGYVFNRGYWDYPLNRRGLAYAPVRFGRGYNYRGSFTPRRYLSPVNLLTSLYIAPRTSRYVYGGFGLNSRAYVPLTRVGNLNGFYDPIYRDVVWRQGRGNQNFGRDWERQYLERVQDYQNSDLADTQRLVRDVSTLSNGGSIGDIVVNRINDEVRQEAVDYRLDQLDRRQRRFRSEVRDAAQDATDSNPQERSAAKVPTSDGDAANTAQNSLEERMRNARDRAKEAASETRNRANAAENATSERLDNVRDRMNRERGVNPPANAEGRTGAKAGANTDAPAKSEAGANTNANANVPGNDPAPNAKNSPNGKGNVGANRNTESAPPTPSEAGRAAGEARENGRSMRDQFNRRSDNRVERGIDRAGSAAERAAEGADRGVNRAFNRAEDASNSLQNRGNRMQNQAREAGREAARNLETQRNARQPAGQSAPRKVDSAPKSTFKADTP